MNPKTQSQSCFTMFMTTQKPEYVDILFPAMTNLEEPPTDCSSSMIKHAAAAHPGAKAEDLFPESFKA